MGNPAKNDPPPFQPTNGIQSRQSVMQPQHPQPNAFRTQLACVTFSLGDCIRFIRFPPDVVGTMQGILGSTWPKGIQDVRDYAGSREFKLHGYPWRPHYKGNDDSRQLVLKIIEALYDMGWVLHAATDLSKKQTARDTLIFHYRNPPPPRSDWICISLYRYDRLRVTPPPQPDLSAALIQTFGGEVSKHEVTREHLEIKFHGHPWVPSSEDTVHMPLMILGMLETFERFGYSMYASLKDQISNEGHDADILVMQRHKNWVPGMPIFHR
ncbi:unnamed protein product [Clonostachys rosea]|uniref:Uncharacterized protein n=1 Tax=Bionectria ochroleuca TaxID=29856 RepID=A0ABY6U5J6_BIOOC|nr:unnamed protein product [Clonostachys rosea]